jgi:peptide/nickel transport system permease protein
VYQPTALEEQAPLVPPGTQRTPLLGTLARIGSALSSNRKAVAGVLILLLLVFAAIFAPIVAPYSPTNNTFLPTAPPSRANLLGTTSFGQDIFSQLVWSSRQTLLLGLIGGLAATVISVLIGVTAAYLGGTTDHVLSVFTDIFLVLPALPLMIVIAAYEKGGGFWVLILVIVITGWSFGARQLRPQALSLRNREFLESARVRGENSAHIIVFELLPNMTSLIVAIFLGAALYAVLAAAGLQFIGLGNPNDLSWGTMLYWAENQEAMLTGSPLWILAPGACIAALGAAVALINYGVDEIGNPALRGKKKKTKRVYITPNP